MIQAATAIALLPADVRAATAIGSLTNIVDYDGNALLVLDAEAQGSGITATVKLQSSPSLAAGTLYQPAAAGTNNIPLRNGAADNVKLAAKFTQAGARSIKEIVLPLRSIGTISSGDIWLTIEGDSSGPDGSAVGTTVKIAAATIGDAYAGVKFTFATPVELTDTTVYHIVLQGDYSASASNQIQWRTATVASGGNSFVYDSSWAAVATNSHEYVTYQYAFTDVTGGAFTAVGNAAALQHLHINVSEIGGIVRGVNTVAGGSATGATSLLLIAVPQII